MSTSTSASAMSWHQVIDAKNGYDFTNAISNATTSPSICISSTPQYVGYLAAIVTSVLFGSNLVPVKKYETGDGVFFQFIQCCTNVVFGTIFNWVIGLPRFEPLAMLGGVMWATGNLFCILVVRLIGLGMGFVLWSLMAIVLGWASDRFGWFGASSEPSIAWLQYAGVALALLRGVVSMFIRPTAESMISPSNAQVLQVNPSDNRALLTDDLENAEENSRGLLASVQDTVVTGTSVELLADGSTTRDFLTRMKPARRLLFGVVLALLAGVLFGLQYAPISYIQNSQICTRDWDYSFAFYSGSFVASFFYTMLYASVTCNRPFINPQSILPAFTSGVMWVVAQTGWFIASESLSQAICFPIIGTGPALVALFWSVFVFGEIRGRTNMILLTISIALSLASVLMVAFSM